MPLRQHVGELVDPAGGLDRHVEAVVDRLDRLGRPGGKGQLAGEAVRFAGDTVAKMLAKRLRAGPVDGLRALLTPWRQILTGTGFRAGCPVLAASVEEPADDDAVLAVAAEVFAGWEEQLAAALREHGAEPTVAEHLATLVVTAIEGAVCRAQRDTRALDRVAAQLEKLVTAAVEG